MQAASATCEQVAPAYLLIDCCFVQEQDSSQDTSTGQDGNQTNVWTELIQFDQSLEEDEELEHPNQHHSNMV